MIHIDVDEFLSVVPRKKSKDSRKTREQKYQDRGQGYDQGQGDVDLADMADRYFLRHPLTPAISFSPVHMLSCPRRDQAEGAASSSQSLPLPRVASWRYGNLSDRSIHNGKLLLRTDAVASFFVHYISSLEDVPTANDSSSSSASPGRWEAVFRVPIKFAALLHYKTPSHVSGSIFGQLLPLQPVRPGSDPPPCKDAVKLISYPEFLARGGAALRALSDYSFEHLAITKGDLETLIGRFRKRMKDSMT